ncbi:cell division protein FtsQ/DivIB [Yeosuana sp. MJ-SS3]|uniref:Cell division protein FtsQ/DivIB n=1 Tax=Gilvirhabdus luticola TaxID=3079858 RepID=A0ABU3U465_9FLAO|nr:cell division protein FtsQ/DivIB [Yeosuana sp. MJ-SS3]MDU8885197.1 cell division protein FtsQ/DivIB [Yeosuana sp. MJ-SS3]
MRKVSEFNIHFEGDNNLFLTEETVSKLLIQNQQGVKKMPKETLDLNQLETALNSNPMVKSAQVYVTLKGELNADIEQKKPIARVSTNASYYIDDQGTYMPLSENHSARVPLVTGQIDKNKLDNVFIMANKIQKDEFLKKNVVEINQNANRTIFLRLRQCSFIVQIGDMNNLDKKINNLKAFYKKSLKEKTLNNYSNVNLQFDNQVVCTKL